MAKNAEPTTEPRLPLTRERVLRAAVDLADEAGITALSMRRLGQRLGVEAMSLYNHVAGKEDVLDGMADLVVHEINDAVAEIDEPSADWKTSMRRRVLASREVLMRHPWAPGVLETRTNLSAPVLRYFDEMIGLFLDDGFSIDLTHHAMHALGSRALGFTQEMFDDSSDVAPTEMFVQQIAGMYPRLAEMVRGISHDADTTLGWCDDQFEFEFALDLLLTGLERLRDRA